MSLTWARQDDLLYWLFGTGSVVRIGNGPSSYVGVCFTNPGDTGLTSDEANYGGRKQILYVGWDAPSGGQIVSNAFLEPWIVTAPALLRYFLLADGPVVLSTHDYSAPLVADLSVTTNDQIRFPVGGLIVSMTGLLTHTYMHDQLDMFLRDVTPTRPANYYWALSTTAPNPDGTNFTEPSGNNYGRAQTTRDGPFGAVSSGGPVIGESIIKNDNGTIIWPIPTGTWGTVAHWGAFDAPTGGNLLLYGALDAATSIVSAEQPSFELSALTITME